MDVHTLHRKVVGKSGITDILTGIGNVVATGRRVLIQQVGYVCLQTDAIVHAHTGAEIDLGRIRNLGQVGDLIVVGPGVEQLTSGIRAAKRRIEVIGCDKRSDSLGVPGRLLTHTGQAGAEYIVVVTTVAILGEI